MSEKEKQQLVSEVNILRELNHKYVVKYYDRVIGNTPPLQRFVTAISSSAWLLFCVL
jgi:serine/threonine protein kinase